MPSFRIVDSGVVRLSPSRASAPLRAGDFPVGFPHDAEDVLAFHFSEPAGAGRLSCGGQLQFEPRDSQAYDAALGVVQDEG